MRAFLLRSTLIVLSISITVFFVCGSARTTEIHVVGNAAYKCVDGEWIQTAPERMGDMAAIWAFSEDDIFIGEYDGAVFHFDGYGWECILDPSEGDILTDIWGTSSSNVYVCVWSGAGGGKFLHYDGSSWSEVVLPYHSDRYQSVYGFAADDIYMVAYDYDEHNVIYHNDSGDPHTWELVNIIPPIHDLEMDCSCVWGSSGDDVFVGSRFGDGIIHYDGDRWELADIETTDNIDDIWGVSANDVYAVTSDELFHYDGEAWTEVPISTSINDMYWIRGVSSDDIIVGGNGNVVAHYNGIDWVDVENGELDRSYDAFMFTSTDAMILSRGGKLFQYNGSTLDRIDQDYWIGSLSSVSGSTPKSVYACGTDGYVYRYDGTSWSEMAHPTTKNLSDIIVFSDDDICVLSADEVFHYDGNSWELIGSGAMGGIEMWGLSSDDLYTVGTANVYDGASVYHYDGNDWEELLYSPYICYDPWYCEEGTYKSYRAVWGASSEDVYVGGGMSWWGWWGVHHVSYTCRFITNYDGVEWTGQGLPFNCPIGDPPSGSQWISAIWGSSATDIWAAGGLYDFSYFSYVCHFDGAEWSGIYAPFYGCSAIWGSSSGDIYFLDGGEGDVYRYDGVDFDLSDVTHATMFDIWGTDITSTPARTPSPDFALHQNHPNPFNPMTTIRFTLRERGHASLAVYDVVGRLVRVLAEGVMEAGPQEVTWDGRNSGGSAVASGVYFYRLETEVYRETRKIVLLR